MLRFALFLLSPLGGAAVGYGIGYLIGYPVACAAILGIPPLAGVAAMLWWLRGFRM